MRKPTMWFPTRSDTNRPVQLWKMARSLKFLIKEEEVLYYSSSVNKGPDLRLCFHIGKSGFLMKPLKRMTQYKSMDRNTHTAAINKIKNYFSVLIIFLYKTNTETIA